MSYGGATKPTGEVNHMIIGRDGVPRTPYPRLIDFPSGLRKKVLNRGRAVKQRSLRQLIDQALPHFSDRPEVRAWKAKNFMSMMGGFKNIIIARQFGIPTFYGALWLKKFCLNGDVLDFGLVSVKLVTTAGVNFIVDAFQNTTEIELFNFHGLGLGAVAEAIGDTALGTELTTQYSTDNTRDTGTQGEGGSANIYQTLGLNQVDASVALREHGVLSQAATGGGTLLDRSVYALINLVSGESLQSTYELTVSAGG